MLTNSGREGGNERERRRMSRQVVRGSVSLHRNIADSLRSEPARLRVEKTKHFSSYILLPPVLTPPRQRHHIRRTTGLGFIQAHMVNLDTFGKLRRKEQMETQLKGLEKDIEKLEKTPVLIRPY